MQAFCLTPSPAISYGHLSALLLVYSKARENTHRYRAFCFVFSIFLIFFLYLLTHAGYVAAIQLTWACGSTACAPRITSEYSFTDLGRMDSCVGCWLVVSGSDGGIQPHASRPRMIRNIEP